MAEVVADLGECGKSPLAKGEWAGDVDLSLAYRRAGSVLALITVFWWNHFWWKLRCNRKKM